MREFTGFSCQFQVSSARASHFLNAETCEFCSSSIVVHGHPWDIKVPYMERGSSVVECRTRNRVSPGSNPPLVPFGRLGIFLLSIDAPVDSAV